MIFFLCENVFNNISNHFRNQYLKSTSKKLIVEYNKYKLFNGSNHILSLPHSVLSLSLHYLDFKTKYNISITSFQFYKISQKPESNYEYPTSDFCMDHRVYSGNFKTFMMKGWNVANT